MNAGLVFSSVCLVTGGLLLAYWALSRRRPALSTRVARAEGIAATRPGAVRASEVSAPDWLQGLFARYELDLRLVGDGTTLRRFLREKLLAAVIVPGIPLLPYLAASGHALPWWLLGGLVVFGFFLPDLALRTNVKRSREAIFLDLPDAIAVASLALGAGKSLRQALELAAKDCQGPLGREIARALSLSRRERGLTEREALVRVADETGEESFASFAQLLASKDSPYLEFLATQAAGVRSEQNRYLERASDDAYMRMHWPLGPVAAVTVFLFAYASLHYLATAI